jgi:uncharacterized protein
MQFFTYCRDVEASERLRDELSEDHQVYMDGFAEAMIARGPTLDPTRTIATGSMHILDLPDADTAWRFVTEEPNYRAGVYGEAMVQRWRNSLAGTMWDFEGDEESLRRFLIIGGASPGATSVDEGAARAQREYLASGGYRPQLIASGPLLSDDGSRWVGSATLIELTDRDAVERMVAGSPLTRAGLYESIEIHDWQFGGR